MVFVERRPVHFRVRLSHHPTPCAPHFTLYTLNPTPHTLHPTPYTLHPTPHTPHPTPCTLHPTPSSGSASGLPKTSPLPKRDPWYLFTQILTTTPPQNKCTPHPKPRTCAATADPKTPARPVLACTGVVQAWGYYPV